jgi:centrosomal protein CEP41
MILCIYDWNSRTCPLRRFQVFETNPRNCVHPRTHAHTHAHTLDAPRPIPSSSLLAPSQASSIVSITVHFTVDIATTMHGKLFSSFDRAVKKTKGGMTPLERKPPRNPRFANVKGTIDTGNSFSKVTVISSREFSRKRDEIFKRVRPITVHELITENQDRVESIYNLESTSVAPASPGSPGGDNTVVVEKSADTQYKRPYLLLDTRHNREDFSICRITSAVHYPVDWLRHDKITPALQHYKNKDSKVIVLYGMNERDGRGVAQQFVEKGFENVFLLSGGLEAFVKEFPLSVEGTLPEQSGLSAKLVATARKSSRPPLGNSNSSNLTRGNIAKAGIETPGSSPVRHVVGGRGMGSSRKAPSVAPSNFSTMSRTESLLNWNQDKRF